MYHVIGKRNGMTHEADNSADRLLGAALSLEMLNHLLRSYPPDGLIIQQGADCFVTSRGELEPFDPRRYDWTNCRKERPYPSMTERDWRREIEEIKATYKAYHKRHARVKA